MGSGDVLPSAPLLGCRTNRINVKSLQGFGKVRPSRELWERSREVRRTSDINTGRRSREGTEQMSITHYQKESS